MRKPKDSSDKPTSKKIQLDPISDTNESNPIIDGEDEFVLFPLDVQETNPITQNTTTSQDDEFILFPLDVKKTRTNTNNPAPITNQKNNKPKRQFVTKPNPQPVTPAVPTNPPNPSPPILKKTRLYWAFFFGYAGYTWVKTEKYYILGIISIVISFYFVLRYFYLRAKLSNRSIYFKLISWIVFLCLIGSGTYPISNYISEKKFRQLYIAVSNYISEKKFRQLYINDSTEDREFLQKFLLTDSVNFMWDASRRRMSVKDYASEKFEKLGYYVTNVSKEFEGNYIVKCYNSDSIDFGLLYSVGVQILLGDGYFRIKDKIKDFKGTEASRISTISSWFSNKNKGGTTVLYVKRLRVDSLLNMYEYEVPITFMSISGTNRLYWIYTVEFINGEITRMSPEVIDRNKYNQLAKSK